MSIRICFFPKSRVKRLDIVNPILGPNSALGQLVKDHYNEVAERSKGIIEAYMRKSLVSVLIRIDVSKTYDLPVLNERR